MNEKEGTPVLGNSPSPTARLAMRAFRLFFLVFMLSVMGCSPSPEAVNGGTSSVFKTTSFLQQIDDKNTPEVKAQLGLDTQDSSQYERLPLQPIRNVPKCALLSTRFKSFEALKEVIQIEYFTEGKSRVQLTHSGNGLMVHSILETGISEADFMRVQKGDLLDKIGLGIDTPYGAFHKNDLMRVYLLSRRRGNLFGEGDPAFYDLAEMMVCHIVGDDLLHMPAEDLGEKGYINTFNHITAQAFMTTLFSEKLADFIADVHERKALPELVTGQFSHAQLNDLENGPIDNYVDMINNEWGQELGKTLTLKYNLNDETKWTPELLANYLNDVQKYYSWAFQIGFRPFNPTDQNVARFATKLNKVMGDVTQLK